MNRRDTSERKVGQKKRNSFEEVSLTDGQNPFPRWRSSAPTILDRTFSIR